MKVREREGVQSKRKGGRGEAGVSGRGERGKVKGFGKKGSKKVLV